MSNPATLEKTITVKNVLNKVSKGGKAFRSIVDATGQWYTLWDGKISLEKNRSYRILYAAEVNNGQTWCTIERADPARTATSDGQNQFANQFVNQPDNTNPPKELPPSETGGLSFTMTPSQLAAALRTASSIIEAACADRKMDSLTIEYE